MEQFEERMAEALDMQQQVTDFMRRLLEERQAQKVEPRPR